MNHQSLRFFIDHSNEEAGWISCYLTFDGQTHTLYASGAYPPFKYLIDFLRSLTLNRLPARLFWNEEGQGPHFEAWPLVDALGSESTHFHLRILHDSHDLHWTGEDDEEMHAQVNSYQVLWVDADFDREGVVDAFLSAVRYFVLYSKQPEDWDISLSDLLAFEQLRARGAAPRSDITHAEPVDMIIKRWQNDEDKSGAQTVELRMWDMRLIRWRLDDTDAFWPEWFNLLEHILAGQTHEFTFINMLLVWIMREMAKTDTSLPAEEGPVPHTRMIATQLNYQHHFRLQIFVTDDSYTDYLIMDEVIDAYQLAGVFLKEFEKLLEGYHPYPDRDGQVFDLRTLPVERLQERLSSIV
jgi:hypothetical protein